MIPLTTEEKTYGNKQKICYICKKEFINNNKKNYKVKDHLLIVHSMNQKTNLIIKEVKTV